MEANIRPPVRSLLLFLPVALATAALVFLFVSGFFSRWDGKAVSVRPTQNLAPESWQVLIANQDGSYQEEAWPASAVAGLGLPFDSLGVPPTRIPETRPNTRKTRFSLYFVVERPPEPAASEPTDDDAEDAPTPTPQVAIVHTASPRAVGAGVLFGLLLLFVRNMVTSGHPLSIEPRTGRMISTPADEPVPSGSSGGGDGDASATGPRAGRPTRPGPPPPPRRRGQGRR